MSVAVGLTEAPLFFVFAVLAMLLARVGSEWIDALYLREPEVLSFPQAVRERSRLRFTVIFLGLMLLFFFASEDLPLVFLGRSTLIYFLLLFIATDFEQQVIFDRMLLPFSLMAFPFIFFLDLSLLPSLVAAFLGGLSFFILAVVTGGGIGGGDIKLIFALGLWFGFPGLKSIIIMGAVFGGIVAVVAMVFKLKKKGEYLAYGPYFCMAAIYLCLAK